MTIKEVIHGERLYPDAVFAEDHLGHDLTRKSVRGGMAAMVSQAIQLGLSALQTVILARLLTPNDYGLVGMVAVVTGFAAMFKNAGLSTATISKKHISSSEICTLFWINVLLSVVLGILLIAVSPWIAAFYHQQELVGITIGLSVAFITSGLAVQHLALLYRHVRFGALAVIAILSQTAGLIMSVILAMFGLNYWALVGGSAAGVLASTLLTFYFCPWLPGRASKDDGARGMLAFGGNLTVGNLANYVSGNMDNILVGKFFGADALGLYAKAYQLFLLPITQIRNPLQNTALPMLSSLSSQPERFRNYYRRFLSLLASLTIPVAIYCLVEAGFVIDMALGPNWSGAIPPFRVFAFVALIYPLAGTQGLITISTGRSRRFLWWSVVMAFLSVLSFVLGLRYGIVGVAGGFAVMNYVFLVPSLLYCLRGTPVTVAIFLKAILAPLITAIFAAGVALLAALAAGSESRAAHILLLLVFVTVYSGLSLCRRSLREELIQVVETLGFSLRGKPV